MLTYDVTCLTRTLCYGVLFCQFGHHFILQDSIGCRLVANFLASLPIPVVSSSKDSARLSLMNCLEHIKESPTACPIADTTLSDLLRISGLWLVTISPM